MGDVPYMVVCMGVTHTIPWVFFLLHNGVFFCPHTRWGFLFQTAMIWSYQAVLPVNIVPLIT